MNDAATAPLPRTPAWVILVIICAGLIEPLTHLWIANVARDDAVFSGLHTPDSAIFLHSMAMFASGYDTPYATCHAPAGSNDPNLYPAPFHWMYGLVGVAGAALGASPFLWLGIVNGLGLAAYLATVYAFLRTTIPGLSNAAFVLFALGGGVGGAAYIFALVFGLTDSAAFEINFHRPAIYELLEGPGLNPLLYGPRLYYTLSLALAFGSLTAWRTAEECRCWRHHTFALTLLFCAAVVNARFAGMAWLVALCFLLTDQSPWRGRVLRGTLLFIPVAAGLLITSSVVSRHPVFAQNTGDLVRQGLWLSAFVTAALGRLVFIPLAVTPAWSSLLRLPRLVAGAAAGYWGAFLVLYAVFHVWHGTLWPPLDHGTIVFAADPALIGAGLGVLWAWRKYREPDAAASPLSPFLLWFVGFLAISVAGVGQGWALQVTPQRFLVFVGVPLSVLAAHGLQALRAKRPRVARAAFGVVVAAGICSIVVGAVFFQGPLGRGAGERPFPEWHAEIIHRDDAAILDNLPQETVVAPGWYADVASVRPGARVLGGFGMADLSDAPSTVVQPQIDALYAGELSAQDAAAFFERWCVRYVWAPATVSYDATRNPLVREFRRVGNSVLYEVAP